MHLVGYLYEDYHDARSREHKDIGRFHPFIGHEGPLGRVEV